MNILPQPQILLFLTSRCLYLFRKDSMVSCCLELDKKIYDHMEVLDAPSFSRAISAFLSSQQLDKKQIVLILSEDILFEKKMDRDNIQNISMEINRFAKLIPLDFEKIAVIKYPKDKEIILMAVNRQIYSAVSTVLDTLGGKLVSVFPSSVFGQSPLTPNLVSSEVNELLLTSIRKKEGNFLEDLSQNYITSPQNALTSPQEQLEEDDGGWINLLENYILRHNRIIVVSLLIGVILAAVFLVLVVVEPHSIRSLLFKS